MKRPKVIIIAQNQPIDNDAHFRRKMINALTRAERQSPRFPNLDLPAIQKGVHENISKLILNLDGRYMDLLDLMNFVKNDRRALKITSANVAQYYSLANSVTLNGIFLYQYLVAHGFDPIIVQNYATGEIADFLQEDPVAVSR